MGEGDEKVVLKFKVGDVETDLDTGEFVIGATYPPLIFHETPESMGNYIKCVGGRFYFHFLDFDLKYIVSSLMPCRVIARNHKPLLVFPIEGRKWEIVDSFALLPDSLENLTRNFDVEHKKLERPSQIRNNEEVRNYLKHDVMGLYEVLVRFFELTGLRKPPLTAGSLSLQCLQKEVKIQKVFPKLPKELDEFCRSAYYGGRVELFEKKASNAYYYDVNSMYPFCMYAFPYPTGRWITARGRVCEVLYRKDLLGIVFAYVYVPESKIGLLPLRVAQKVIFPTGGWCSVYTSSELKFAESYGATVIPVFGVFWRQKTFPFRGFVERWYQVKKKGGSWKAVAKLVLNSLYGKFGERTEREMFIVKPECDAKEGDLWFPGLALEKVPQRVVRDYHRVYVSAFVTSYARVVLGTILKMYEDDVVYCDTDSVVLKRPLPEHMVGDELGQWKLERIGEFTGVAEKFYLFKTDKELLVKLKGAPKKFVTYEDVLRGIEEGEVVVSGVIPNTFYSYLKDGEYLRRVEKHFKVYSDKRVWLSETESLPHEIHKIREDLVIRYQRKVNLLDFMR